MSRFTLSTSFAAALALCVASGAGADRLLAPTALPETQLTFVSDSSARAFDHIRAARQQIESRLPVEARRELVEARKLLAEARAAIPANRVLDRIAGLLARLEDPTQQVATRDLEPLMAEIDTAGAGDAYDATRRYVERSRYYLFYGNREAASRELVAAAARVPYGRLDAPLGASYERVNQAMVFLFDHDLVSADALLQAAENNAHAVIQIAAGAEEVMLPDVAAPPEPMAVEIIEEEIAPVAPFDAPPGAETLGEAAEEMGGSIVEEAGEAVEAITPELPALEAAPQAPFDPPAGAETLGEAAQEMGGSIVEEAGEAVEAITPELPPVEAAPKAPVDPQAGAGTLGEAAQEMGGAIVEEAGEAVEAITPELPPVEAAPKAPVDPQAGAETLGEAAQEMGGSIVEEAGEAVEQMTPKLPAPKAPAVE